MNTVKLLSKYPRIDLKENEVSFEVEQVWNDRPAWIRLNDVEQLPRFVSIQVPKFGELIYKSFGRYYYPFDYTNDEERRFMDGMALDYDSMVADVFNVPMARALLEKVPLNEVPRDGHVLDLGCGTGIISDILAGQGYRSLTLVDFSQGMLDAAKVKPLLHGAKFVKADVTREIPDGNYSLVVSVMLFNTFDSNQTNSIMQLVLPKLAPSAIFATLEDTEKTTYTKHFETIFSGMVDVANRTKFIFVGRLKR